MSGFAGFDTSAYPGDTVMKSIKATTNLTWCGFYLGPAPSHGGSSWMKKQTFLRGLGFGLAPLYLGQQIIGHGSHHSDSEHGYTDGKDATVLAGKAGFEKGSVIYLDLENGMPFGTNQHAYVSTWADQVQQDGFRAGIYCSHTIVEDVHQLMPAALMWVYKVTTTKPHSVPGPLYPDNHPAGSGYAGAYIWQLGQYCQINIKGAPTGRLVVDLDSSLTLDPSLAPSALTPDGTAIALTATQ